LAHRRNHDPIAKGEAADLERGEELAGHGCGFIFEVRAKAPEG
jgi:hypothetical protein